VRKFTMQNFHGMDGMLGQSATFPAPTGRAVATPAAELICSIVRKNPGKVSLVPILSVRLLTLRRLSARILKSLQ
jgi:inosine-uridine nucleoside N-ribohydrolase